MAAPSLSELYGDCVRSAGHHPACDEFFRIFRPALTRVARRVAYQYNSPQHAEDAEQEVSLKLLASGETILRRLPAEPLDALAYFSVVAANAARDFFRALGAAKKGSAVTVSIDTQLSALSASLGVSPDVDKNLIMGRSDDLLPTDRREQIAFRFYYYQGYTAKEIAAIPDFGLSVKGVESMIFRITRGVRERFHSGRNPEAEKGIPEPDAFL